MKLSKPMQANTRCRNTAVQICLDCCRKTLSELDRVKEAIFAEFGHAFRSREKLLRLAVNEAEALAWETPYPHLVFPNLAAEKAQKLMAWSKRQQAVRQTSQVLAFSA